jgi:hypothetical protein
MRASRLLAVLLIGAAGLAAPAAFAQKPDAKPAAKADVKPAADKDKGDPRKLYASGEDKFKKQDYEGALADFTAADAIKAAPQAARYIGLCHDNLKHYKEAVAAYERFLADVPPKMKDQGEEIKKRVEAIKAMPGKVHLESTPAGATVVVDDKPQDKPTPTDLELAPGKHKIKLSADKYEPGEKEVDVEYASKQDVKVELTAKPEPPPPPPPPPVAETKPPPPPPPPPEPRSKLPAYITGGIAVVAAGLGTGFGIAALSDKSDFDKNPTTEKADSSENKALIADMAFGVAITFGVTSAVLFLSDDAPEPAKSTKAKPKPTVTKIVPTPIITPHGGGAGASFRF